MLIVPLDDPEASVVSIGGKGLGLARLAAAGFAVPRAYAVPTAVTAAAEFDSARFREALSRALVQLAPEGEAIAVRSSATDEDSQARSFAGQHLTVLGVRGPDEAISAMRRCVASLRSPEAAAYRASSGASEPAGMAVILQRMVEADAAGVAFSMDPVTGANEAVVIEAVRGLGETLVSGQREADRWSFQRETLALVDSGGPRQSGLGEEEAREVARLTLAVEEALGAPQDIEFAIERGKVWLLQARPVTSAPAGLVRGEFDTVTSPADLWTSANISEVLPGMLTPLTITAFAENGNRAYCRAYQGLKMLAKDECPPFVGFFHHRAFLHVGNTRLIAERAFASSADAVEERFLGAEKAAKPRRVHSWKNIRRRFISLVPLLRMTRTIGRRGEEAEAQTLAFEARLRALDLRKLSGAQLDGLRNDIAELVAGTFAVHLQASGCAGAGYDLVARMVRPILKERTEGAIPVLFAGMSDVESARISLDLWGLTQIARETGVEGKLGSEGFDPSLKALPSRWQEAYAAFMERHGHRGVFEMEPAEPNWRRDPSQVLRLLAGYLEIEPAHSPPSVLERREKERLELTASLERRMNPLKRRLFRSILRDAQSWVALRERTKSVIVRGTRLVDIVVPEAADRLTAAGSIANPGDIYFITGDELADALRASNPGDLRPAVQRRRRAFERDRHLRIPERFEGYPQPLSPGPASDSVDVLRGTPVSPGHVTGRARVILDPRGEEAMHPGEILVAPVTDAGWTPLFALATGLVVDIGSALSHGSTVAREYGLPAVVNVRNGTSSIRTGDLLAIDGAAGTVAIVERAQL
jgi:pyruvate,water dikinase